MAWEEVEEALPNAKLIAWDECHKIYLALDETEAKWFRESGYTTFSGDTDTMLGKLHDWFDESCGLRFINGVTHNATDPNAGFSQLIAQFELDEWDDDEVEDEDEDED